MKFDEALLSLKSDSTFDFTDVFRAPNYMIAVAVGGRVAESLDSIDYGTFHNGREWGLTFSAGLWSFCVYELRAGDRIQIQGCPTSEVQYYGPYGGNPNVSYDTLYSAPEEAYEVVAVALISMLRLAADGKDHSREEMSEAAWVKSD